MSLHGKATTFGCHGLNISSFSSYDMKIICNLLVTQNHAVSKY